MFIKNDNVMLRGADLQQALGQYSVSPQVMVRLEDNIRRALRAIRALADAEEVNLAQVTCRTQTMVDMLMLDIEPVMPANSRFLPSEGFGATIRFLLNPDGTEIISVQELMVRMTVLG